MGCCAQSRVTDFARVNSKTELKHCFNNEMNRIKILRQTMVVNPSKPEEQSRYATLDLILHDHSWMILVLLEALGEEHVNKIKFLLMDYFSVTETWSKKDFEDNYIKILNFKKDNNIKCELFVFENELFIV